MYFRQEHMMIYFQLEECKNSKYLECEDFRNRNRITERRGDRKKFSEAEESHPSSKEYYGGRTCDDDDVVAD